MAMPSGGKSGSVDGTAKSLNVLRAFAQQTHMQVGPRTLAFTDRVVVLLRATAEQLTSALDVLDDLAELRRPRVPPS